MFQIFHFFSLQMRQIIIGVCIIFPVINAIAFEQAIPESVGLSSNKVEEFKKELQRRVEDKKIPGAVLMVLRNGKIAVNEVVGMRDPMQSLPMLDDAIFSAASMTKPIISVAAMVLIEQGKMNLTDPLSKYISEFKDPKVGVQKKNAKGNVELTFFKVNREITIQDLMRHTAGLANGELSNNLVDQQYLKKIIFENDINFEKIIPELAKLPLKYQPGKVWDYGDSTDVLGRVIEVITNKPLEIAIADLVTDPLEMIDTKYWVDPSKLSRYAYPTFIPTSEKSFRKTPPTTKPNLITGGTGLFITARDYAKFCQMMLNKGELNGVRIISRKNVEMMTSNQLPPGVEAKSIPFLYKDILPRAEIGLGFGLGFAVRTDAGKGGWAGSVGEFWWLGASGTNFVVDPVEKMIVILLIAQPNMLIENLHLMRNMGSALIKD